MILLVQNENLYENDFRAMIQAFFPAEKIVALTPPEVAEYDSKLLAEYRIIFTALFLEQHIKLKVEEGTKYIFSTYLHGDHHKKEIFRNKIKLASYRLLSEYTGKTLPWGSLTGMRPTKIASKALAAGLNKSEIIEHYKKVYETTEEKADLSADVAIAERDILGSVDSSTDYCLYVGIPFCPSRCLYCSFASYSITEFSDRVDNYLDALEKELMFISYVNRDRNLVSIYVGGGTPTSLDEKRFERLLTMIQNIFDFSKLLEYTVEAGRPDSITLEKLKSMRRHKVTRISINPQTMNDKTLELIGRKHNTQQVYEAFSMARQQGFKHINMDIIAGLPGEDRYSMEHTLKELSKLKPDSLTVHSLAIKRAARLSEEMDRFRSVIGMDMTEALDMAHEAAEKMDLYPYYLYRQKNIGGNLENVGYARRGMACRYNVLIIEEKLDIFAAGAGAVTRLMTLDKDKNVIKTDRVEDVKSVVDYIERIDEMIERKRSATGDKRILEETL